MGNRRVWLSGGVLVLLLALAIVGMRAWRTHANADGAYEPSAHGTAPPQGSSWWTRTERSPAEPPAGSGEPAAAKPPPWKQDGRSDEEVLANYTQEELEKSGLTPQSMFYRQQAMALVDVLPLASRVGGKDLVQHLRLVGQGLSFAAMPGIKSDPAKVLQAQRDTFARLRKELSAQLGEKLYEEGPTLADWLKKREGDLANAAAGRGPSTADALRRAEWDHSLHGDKKHAKDDDEPDVKPGERPPEPYEDDDDGNVYAPISPAVERSLHKQAAEKEE
jgi:hypothetical protein